MLLRFAQRLMASRAPDFVIGGHDRPYMLRWWVIPRNRWFNIYLHRILRDDDDRALHDHPWVNCSILLAGAYREIMPARRGRYRHGEPVTLKRRQSGSIVLRWPTSAHRLIVDGGAPVVSLFITGPVVRDWGFYAPQGWVFWREFTDPADPGLYQPKAAGAQS